MHDDILCLHEGMLYIHVGMHGLSNDYRHVRNVVHDTSPPILASQVY